MTSLALAPMRAKPHVEYTHLVQNKSSRHGAKIELIVLHATQARNIPGLTDLKGLGGWFDTPAADASANVGVDGEGLSARYVRDVDKSWGCAFYNPIALNLEQVGFAEQTSWPDKQLRETARWIALWSKEHDLPIRHGRVLSNGVVAVTGVVRHSELGRLGGGHHDPDIHLGDYPLHDVLALARTYRKHL